MAIYAYKGLDSNRSQTSGTILADSPRHARDNLRVQGVIVQSLKEQKQVASHSNFGLFQFGTRRARSQWGLGAHELSMLLSAGIPLLEALDTMAGQHRGKFRSCMLQLKERVEAGTSLAAAMSEQSSVFDAASVRIVEVGENAGTLEQVLAEIAEFKLQMHAFKDKLTTSLMYPVFVGCFGIAAMIFLMTWVMPPLLESLQETLPQLPWPTRVAKALSDFLIQFGWQALAILIVLLIGGSLWLRTESGKQLFHRAILKLPVIGPIVLKQSIARAAMIVGLLTRSGVMLTTAVNLAARSTDNSIIKQALLRAEKDMTAGEDIAVSLERSACFPPLAVRFFAVGQESGKLDEMLQKLARDYNMQVSTAASRLTALVEPVLILLLAVAVGFLLLATILPILEAGNVS